MCIWLIFHFHISRMYTGVGTRALRSHSVAQFGRTGTDELPQCNTRSVSLPPGEYGPLSGCGLKHPINRTCSILLESPGGKTHSLSRDLFKFSQDHIWPLGFSSFVTTCLLLSILRKWTDEAAGYYNPTPENTYRPFVTKNIDNIFFSFFFFKLPPPPPPLPSFYAIPSKYFIINPSFCLLPFWQNLIYVITGNKKRKNILWVYCTAGVSDTAWW